LLSDHCELSGNYNIHLILPGLLSADHMCNNCEMVELRGGGGGTWNYLINGVRSSTQTYTIATIIIEALFVPSVLNMVPFCFNSFHTAQDISQNNYPFTINIGSINHFREQVKEFSPAIFKQLKLLLSFQEYKLYVS
jgi:hypothetical protein